MCLPVDEGQTVSELWYMTDDTVRSAKLKGSLEGDARMAWWEEQKKFKIVEEKEESKTEADA